MRALHLIVLGWMFLAGALRSGLLGPNRSAIRAAYGLSETEFGAAVALVQIGASAAALLGARALLARWTSVRVMVLALVVAAAGFAVVGSVPRIEGFVAGWGLVMVAFVLGSVSNNISMDLWPRDPRRGVIVLHTSNGAGKIAGALVSAAWLAVGWRLSFATFAAGTAVLAAVFVAWYRAAGAPVPSAAPAPMRHAPRRDVLRRPIYWMILAGFGLASGSEAVVATLLPEYFELARGMSAQAGTGLLLVHFTGILAGRLIASAVGRRVTSAALIASGVAAGAMIVPVLLVEELAAAGVCVFLLGLAFASLWPTFYARAARHLPHDRDMLAYGSYLGSNLGVAVAILASSRLADSDLAAGLAFGPLLLAAFGVLYFATPLGWPPTPPFRRASP